MPRILWQGRIVMTDTVHGPEPCFKGTQIAVRHVVADLADGNTLQEIVAENPELTEDDVAAALSYAADALAHLAKRTRRESVDVE